MLAVTSIGGSIVAGALYDVAGSYTLFLTVLVPLTIIGAGLVSLVGNARTAGEAAPPVGAVPGAASGG
ncbi:hypothetical protein FHS96_000275 [Sphingomonas zeicaulis]|uniref:hypothetical protein n=1 Tax=Sphingomonas zeicaulis TaxID=1632740 RepID=UPI003D1AB6F4